MTHDNTDTDANGVVDSDIDTNSLKLGSDWEQTYDANNNRLLIEYTPNGNQFELNEDGTLKPLDGDIDLGGINSITNAQSVSTAEKLSAPLYTDNTNAVQENRSIWYNDGSGPDASGYYAYDNGTVTGPLESGGTSEWEVDGSGNLVPIDGEPIGDGTTTANHQSVNTEQIKTVPQGARLKKDSTQAIPDDGEEHTLTWETAERDTGSFADLSGDQITIPSGEGYSAVRIGLSIIWGSYPNGQYYVPRIDGITPAASSNVDLVYEGGIHDASPPPTWTDWVEVSGGESITGVVSQNSGGYVNIESDDRVWLAVNVM